MGRSLSPAACLGLVALVLLACAPAGGPAAPSKAASAPAASAPAPAAPAAAPAAPAPAPAAPPEPVTVRLGMIPSLAGAPLLAGAELGIFERNGINLEITPFTDTAAAMTQVVAGHLDAGHITIGSATLNAFSRGVDLVLLNSGALASSPVMIRKELVEDGSVRSIADLRGRRVSINTKGVIHEYVLFKVLQSGGLTFDDVDLNLMPWPEQVIAMGNRALDMGIVVEPIGSQAVARGAAILYQPPDAATRGEPWFAPGLQGAFVMANRRWAETNPAAATALVKSYVEGARRIQGRRIFDDDAALAAIEKWTKVTPEAVRQATPSYFALNGQVHVESLMEAQRYFIATGTTTYKEPLTIEQLHDDRYVKAALAEIGIVPEAP
jgi:NitT/TauT family transport system substrate-binding protein